MKLSGGWNLFGDQTKLLYKLPAVEPYPRVMVQLLQVLSTSEAFYYY